jgi:acetyl-CoA/propionyl-CoA carboxylase carboxyl transferase subunit
MTDPKDPEVRIKKLIDSGSFEFLLPRTNSGMIAATGTIKGNKVVVFASDATSKSGALGIEGSNVILSAYREAMSYQLPIIGIWHSGGARLSDGVLSLDAFGQVFNAMVLASGRIPQLSLVLGPTAGGGAYGPALTDVVVLAPEGRIFVTGPDVVKSVTGEDIDIAALGGPEAHSKNSGVAHVIAPTEEVAFAEIQDQLRFSSRLCLLAR